MQQRFFAPKLQDSDHSNSKIGSESAVWKRVGHGSVAWSAATETTLWQPQDGASARREGRVSSVASAVEEIHARLPRLQNEPEDARLTGGTRSLMRRVMGLNVTAKPATRRPAVRATAAHAQVA
ncbi:MAG TPA: hypothetical protein VHY48_08705 [Acidobacteriaceae bacterium]|jgi:hypothetical protein|nr:hypothetical protein [Acidobacteriaceae bacterium]